MKKLLNNIRISLQSLYREVFPRYCPICGCRLSIGEWCLCPSCTEKLPRTNYYGRKENPTERRFVILGPRFKRASSFLFYSHDVPFSRIYTAFKYNRDAHMAVQMGRLMALDLSESDFLNTVDCIVPIPLTRMRKLHRGYNQSEMLARGFSSVTGLPVVVDAVVRCHFHQSQTHLRGEAREKNVGDAFALVDASLIAGKHVLLVDDIITYGSTMRACAKEVLKAEGTTVSILSLGTSMLRYNWEFPKYFHVWDV